MRTPSTFLTLAGALALGACAQSADDTATSKATATATTADAGAGAEAAATTDTTASGEAAAPAEFVNAAAASDMFEIESGRLAQEKASSQAVKDFGAMLVREHTQSTADLKAAAGEANTPVAPKMTAKQQADLSALRAANDDFDGLYKTQQIAAHQQALALLQAQANAGAAGPLKAFAAKTAPVVEKHLAQARELP